jgi:hypothetical protein
MRRGQREASHDRPVVDASLQGNPWPIGQRYLVVDGLGSIGMPLQRPSAPVGEPPAWWWWDDGLTRPRRVHRADPAPDGARWMRLIVDASPDPRTMAARAWHPADQSGLADELAALAGADEVTIFTWVRQHGFLGLRADPRERCEGIEEIRDALVGLSQALALVRALRSVSGRALRTQIETILGLPDDLLDEFNAEGHPLSGAGLARRIGLKVPAGVERWDGAGAFVQTLYWLGRLLDAPLRRYVRVRTALMPLPDGMRLQPALDGVGPLGVAYLQVLDEASWPAITYEGSSVTVHWTAARRCGHCGNVFRPGRRDQQWCSRQCRWAATKARRRAAGGVASAR